MSMYPLNTTRHARGAAKDYKEEADMYLQTDAAQNNSPPCL